MSLETPSVQPQITQPRKGKWRTLAVVGLGAAVVAYGGVDQYRAGKKASADETTIATLRGDLTQSQATVARLEAQMAEQVEGLQSKDEELQALANETKAATEEHREKLQGLQEKDEDLSTQVAELFELPRITIEDRNNMLALIQQTDEFQQAQKSQEEEIASLRADLVAFNESLTVEDITDICKEVKPSVVEIGYFFSTQVKEKGFLGIKKAKIKTKHAGGSGIVTATIDGGKKGGYIATNWHVIDHDGATDETLKDLEVQVQLFDGTKVKAKPFYITDAEGNLTLAKDEVYDLILLITEDDISNTKVASFADKEPEDGELIISVGSPLGLEQSASMGIVSKVRDAKFNGANVDMNPKSSSEGEIIRIVQVDASINRGNSGGPAFRATDRKVVLMLKFIKTGDYVDNIGFGPSAHQLLEVIKPWILATHTLDDSGRFIES